MNFQNIGQIKSGDYYLDLAFREARKAYIGKGSKRSEENIAKKKSLVKITAINQRLSGDLNRIIQSFPRVDDLNDFYIELFKCYFSVDQYKKDLSKINWLKNKVSQFSSIYAKKVKTSKDPKEIEIIVKQYYGRTSSFFRQVGKSFENLIEYRQKLREMPDVKEDCLNVALFGFPNVGKSTLLSKLTKSKPKISNYAFTTKNINIGYKKIGNLKVQVFDTPGTLNRFSKMNDIEKQAHLVVSELADLVIYVFDPSESYPYSDQKKLFSKVKGEVVAFCSKTDLFPDSPIIHKEKCLTNLDELNEILKESAKKKELELLN